MSDSTNVAYRLVTPAEWAAWCKSGNYAGSDVDTKDGFLHLSVAGELEESASRYFRAHPTFYVTQIALDACPGRVEWAFVSSRRAIFPHLHESSGIPNSAVTAAWECKWDALTGAMSCPPALRHILDAAKASSVTSIAAVAPIPCD